MTRSLFTEDDKHTDEANVLWREMEEALRPIFAKCQEDGLSLREVAYISMNIGPSLATSMVHGIDIPAPKTRALPRLLRVERQVEIPEVTTGYTRVSKGEAPVDSHAEAPSCDYNPIRQA